MGIWVMLQYTFTGIGDKSKGPAGPCAVRLISCAASITMVKTKVKMKGAGILGCILNFDGAY